MIVDLDAIYKDGKMFGYVVECTDDEKGAITKIAKNDHEYIVSFRFDWEFLNLLIQVIPEDHSMKVPRVMRFCHSFYSLFNLKDGLIEMVVRDTVDRIITGFERRYNNSI